MIFRSSSSSSVCSAGSVSTDALDDVPVSLAAEDSSEVARLTDGALKVEVGRTSAGRGAAWRWCELYGRRGEAALSRGQSQHHATLTSAPASTVSGIRGELTVQPVDLLGDGNGGARVAIGLGVEEGGEFVEGSVGVGHVEGDEQVLVGLGPVDHAGSMSAGVLREDNKAGQSDGRREGAKV